MPAFKLNSQKAIDEDYQGINLSEFIYSNDENFSEKQLIDCFVHSNSFTDESRRKQIKNHKGDIPFLRQAFEIDFVEIIDFNQPNKNGLIQFLNDYSEQDDWGDTDGNDFVKLKDRIIEFLKTAQSDNFYLISKE